MLPWIPASSPVSPAEKWLPSLPPTEVGSGGSYWTGTTFVNITMLGWWDGTTVQPAELLGWWDGTSIQPLV